MPLHSHKIKTSALLQKIIKKAQSQGKKIVFTNGCFDLLHIGHVQILRQSKDLGDLLTVAVNTDNSVRRLKGKERPVISLKERMEMLAAFEMVDYVTCFGEDTPEKIIKKLSPDVLVKGGDYIKEQVVGAQYMEQKGGKVVILPYIKGKSSSILLGEIKKLS